MADGLRLNEPGRLWATLAIALVAGTLLLWLVAPQQVDWQPALVWREPWRLWTAAFVHWSELHLGANMLGTALVGILGVSAGAPARLAWAWFAAWPLTHLGLLLQPELASYGGLSGVLHAGAAAAALWLVLAERGKARAIGAAVLLGVFVKVVLEEPWGAPLRESEAWDIALAPLAHASGAAAGALCAALAWVSQPRPHAQTA